MSLLPEVKRNVGRIYAWQLGDPLPGLPPLRGLGVERAFDLDLVCQVSGLDVAEAEARVREGNAPYLARLDGRPAAVGWSAHSRAHVGELARAIELPPGSRYLWDFYTSPELRCRGIYPRLLQTVLGMEAEAERFWVGHNAENVASGKGILRAGFLVVGDVWAGADGLRLIAQGETERAAAAAALLGIPLLAGAQLNREDGFQGMES